MENLGVVPLFLSLAFLLAPTFFFLLALFIFVILPRETIIQLLKQSAQNPFLLISSQLVKSRSVLMGILLVPGGPGLASELDNDYVICVGEHLEIPSQGLYRFSVTDRQVISYKWLEQRSRFLLEGKKVGYSELIIWDKNKQKNTHRLYVLSKRSFLKLKQVEKVLHHMGLSTSIEGPILVAQGMIKEKKDYFILHKLLRQNKKGLHLDVSLDQKLRNDLIGQAYRDLFPEAFSGVSCDVEGIKITCYYQKEDKLSKSILRKLQQDYAIQSIPRTHSKAKQNYRIRLLIFQLERTDGKEMSLGLDQLETTGEELFSHGIKGLIAKNQILLQNNHIQVSTLAWPELVAIPYRESTVEMGSDIPFESKGKKGKKIQWKFAGIKLKMTLKPHGHRLKVHYTTEVKGLSKGKTSIRGGRNQSTVIVPIGSVHKIFQIGLQTMGRERGEMPILGKIPLLGKIFSSSGERQNFKKIVGYLKLEEMK